MTKPKVFVTRRIPEPGLGLLAVQCDVAVHEGEGAIGREELIARVADIDGLLCMLSDKIDGAVLDAAPNLKVISTYSVGYDHIDVRGATERGIPIGYTPGILTDATADHAFALLVASARRIAEADRHVRAGKWDTAFGPTFFLGESLWGATIGIIGFGRIGRAVALRAGGFRMTVLYHAARRLAPGEERDLGVEYRSLEGLIRESDFVTLHVPYTQATHHMIGREQLQGMKEHAIVVNTSRGAVVDESALIAALRERRIGGAGLDVYEKEPLAPDNPLLLLDNVTLAPHLGSATRKTRSNMAGIAARNLLSVLHGEPPVHWLNPEAARVRPLTGLRML
jgi:glyoxylate reductase